MAETDQLTPDHPFSDLDDDTLTPDPRVRLAQLENGLRHFQALLPGMIREVEIARSELGR